MKKLLFVAALMMSMAAGGRVPFRFNSEGEFKIVQLTDLHYNSAAETSHESLRTIGRILDEERPDLVVITGDVVIAEPMQKGWDEVLAPIIARRLPYAVVLGNHDQEQSWSRSQIIDYVARKPFSLTLRGSKKLTGAGNYIINVYGKSGKGDGESGGKTGNRARTRLFMMDSGDYSPFGGYGWFGCEQVEWFRKEAARVEGGKGGNIAPIFAFFHIPLHEFALLKPEETVGTHVEEECIAKLNSGMFAAMVESGNVGGVFVGHDHNNDYIGNVHGIWLAYGRFSGGDTIYNDSGKGARVIVLKEGSCDFATWIRTAEGEVLYKIDTTNK